jgi:hypothetical protein
LNQIKNAKAQAYCLLDWNTILNKLSNINWTDKAGFNQKNISIDISFSNSNL